MTLKETALVTGAGRGIGRAVAIALAASGRFVYINYRSNDAAAQATLEQIEAAGGQAALLPFDVTEPDQVQKALKTLFDARQSLEILVNNAGIREDRLLAMMKPDAWETVLGTNLGGFYQVTKPVVKKMLSRQYGRIVNIASTSGQAGQAGQVNYSASKAGLIGATKALAKEVAKRHITVNAVSPGFIETEMVDGMRLDDVAAAIPAGRLGRPEEVAAAVLFLCSDQAGYITGQVLGVNGGLY